MIDREFSAVVDAFESSAAYRSMRMVIDRIGAASTDSAFIRPTRKALASWRALTPARQLAFASMTVAWSALALLVVRAMLPRYATSGLPWWWNVTVAVFAALVALSSDRIAAAWPQSSPARAWRRLIS